MHNDGTKQRPCDAARGSGCQSRSRAEAQTGKKCKQGSDAPARSLSQSTGRHAEANPRSQRTPWRATGAVEGAKAPAASRLARTKRATPDVA